MDSKGAFFYGHPVELYRPGCGGPGRNGIGCGNHSIGSGRNNAGLSDHGIGLSYSGACTK